MNNIFYEWNALVTESDLDSSLVNPLLKQFPGLELHMYDRPKDDTVELSKIVVPEELRSSGIGTKVMEQIISWADKNNKTLTLTPDTTFGGTSVNRLKRFYSSHGFILNKGRKKDYTVSDLMYRKPKPLLESNSIKNWINENMLCYKKHNSSNQ